MQKYIKNYCKYHNICEQDVILCEVCGRIAVDIHHIKYRSQGGSDDVDNLIALCRKCHDLAHAKEITEEELYVRKKHTKIHT